MKKYLVFLAVALLQAGAWAVTYTYAGSAYAPSAITDYTNCTIGTCGNFTAAMSQSGSFTTAAPLPDNFSNADIASLITSFSFSDGLTQYNSSDPETTLYSAKAFTDASGGVLDIYLTFFHWQASPHVIGSRIDMMVLRQGVRKNGHCQGAVFQTSGGQDVCSEVAFDASSSAIGPNPSTIGTWTVTGLPPVAANAVPTLGEWSLLLLALVMISVGWMTMSRRRM